MNPFQIVVLAFLWVLVGGTALLIYRVSALLAAHQRKVLFDLQRARFEFHRPNPPPRQK